MAGNFFVVHGGHYAPIGLETLSEAFRNFRDDAGMNGERCAIWPITDKRNGYAVMKHRGGFIKVYRLMYELFVGPIPKGMSVLHSCDNPACINPAHLRVATHAENMAEMARKGRSARGTRHPCAKLTEDLVREIRTSDETLHQLAARLGMGISALGSVRRRETWRHIV